MPSLRNCVRLMFAATLLPCVLTPAFAQVNATLGGTVTDSSGAVMPMVGVAAKNNATGIVTSGTTNAAGAYEFPTLQPGTYTVTATMSGFKTETYNNVALGQNQQVRLNFTMQVATAGETVEVVAEADTALATTTSSVGGVLTSREVETLPVLSRNVLDLVTLTPGVVQIPGVFAPTVVNFMGTQTQDINTTRDGMVSSDGRYNSYNGAYSATFTSPDMVEEVRVSTNTIDPALGRGSAQVQMRTRSGGNDFHGALFYTNANSGLESNPYFANLQGQKLSYENRNQFGGRLGGPIKRNKLFFFFLTDDQRYQTKVNMVSTVLTATARQGIFRYLTVGGPGGASRKNGNAFSTTPSVDLNGNILASANGQPLYLNQINMFTQVGDPNRTGIDPIWVGPQYLSRMPLPNNYTVGDGLNTAGYQWQQTQTGVDGATGQSPDPNRNNYTMRFDYFINERNKVDFIMTREHDWGVTGQTGLPGYPAMTPGNNAGPGFFGDVQRRPNFYTGAWVYTITPSLLNEFRVGYKVDTWQGTSPIDLGCCWGASQTSLAPSAKQALATFPVINGANTVIQPDSGGVSTVGSGLGTYATINVSSPRQTISPFLQFADTVSWNHGAHSFQGGFDISRTSSAASNAGNAQTTRPLVTLGNGPVLSSNLTTSNFAGLNSLDQATAQLILSTLAGTVSSISEQYWVNSPTAANWLNYQNGILILRDNHSNAWSAFFKDNWKVTRNLTVNLGIRYDWFGTPYMSQGLGGKWMGGAGGLFGISGNSFATTGTPYANSGQLSQAEFVGPNSPNPGATVYNNDNTSFGPSVGIAYQMPWFKRSTVFRAGYGLNYVSPLPDYLSINTDIGGLPGQTLNTANPVGGYVSVASLVANSSGLVPVPTGGALPFAAVPLTNRSAPAYGYADNLRNPYIQVFNASIQRELTHTLTLDVSYIGNKSTKLQVNQNINDVDIMYNGFLDAFNAIRAGGDSPLIDSMLNGLTIPGVGTVGQNGLTGSSALRKYNATNGYIANGQVGALANFLNTTAAFGPPGAAVRKNGFPEQFFVVNPQFGPVYLVGNNGNETYNAVQGHLSQRFSHGFSGQFAYTFSKTLGDGGVYRAENNLALSKSLLPSDRTHVIQQNFTYLLPFGKSGSYLTHAPIWVDEVIGGWQISSGMTWQSGAPLTFTAVNTLNQYGSATAQLVNPLPANYEQVVKGNGYVTYYPSLSVQSAPTPNFGTGSDAVALAGKFTNLQVVGPNGQVILANAQPGFTGDTALNMPQARGPGLLSFNGAGNKIFRVKEKYTFTLRADVLNLLNKPQWGNPNTNINSTSFGRITTATGSRTVVVNGRFDF
ncbi:MAG TPA: TonB-dependent receptor [Bryobacteraceae bacterium]|nr:TonB-dependent receptor [Bryobacteraceae bacterium]